MPCSSRWRTRRTDSSDLCLMDVKEAVESAAPTSSTQMPENQAQRVIEGALHISPFLGERMRASTLLGRPVFIRELMPQDLKLELNELNPKEAMKAAAFLATVVGFAHARQMDSSDPYVVETRTEPSPDERP